MNILEWLLGLALVFVLIFVGFYLWAVRGGQFDDVESPAQKMLLDDIVQTQPKDGK